MRHPLLCTAILGMAITAAPTLKAGFEAAHFTVIFNPGTTDEVSLSNPVSSFTLVKSPGAGAVDTLTLVTTGDDSALVATLSGANVELDIKDSSNEIIAGIYIPSIAKASAKVKGSQEVVTIAFASSNQDPRSPEFLSVGALVQQAAPGYWVKSTWDAADAAVLSAIDAGFPVYGNTFTYTDVTRASACTNNWIQDA